VAKKASPILILPFNPSVRSLGVRSLGVRSPASMATPTPRRGIVRGEDNVELVLLLTYHLS
jgi:hypothetical protein